MHESGNMERLDLRELVNVLRGAPFGEAAGRVHIGPSRMGSPHQTEKIVRQVRKFQGAVSNGISGCVRKRGGSKGTREIRVILYAKDDPFCATALADELPIEGILAVEHDIVPFDWAVCSSRERSIPLASGSHSLAGTCRAARNLPRSGWRHA